MNLHQCGPYKVPEQTNNNNYDNNSNCNIGAKIVKRRKL